MKYLAQIQAAADNPKLLEELYQAAQQADDSAEFRVDLLTSYQATPDNILYTAWYYRLEPILAETPEKTKRSPNWKLAIPLGMVTGLIFWALSGINLTYLDDVPSLVILWAPIATLFALVFLAFTAKRHYWRALGVGVVLMIACVYVLLLVWGQNAQAQKAYLILMAIHLPLLAWVAIGITILGWKSSPDDRFAFLIKSIEVMVAAGLYLIAGVVFGGITIFMFQAVSINFSEVLMRLIAAGGVGLLPVLALATMYDPAVNPIAQDFSQGLSKFIATLMRLLLPLTLVVLVIYLFVIPFRFAEPFNNRDVLIVYNVLLFAIMGLLIGATPIRPDDLSPRLHSALRSGILAVATLTVLISLYALSAVVYRTILGGITINRLTIIGWNSINIALLGGLIFRQFKAGRQAWVASLRSVFSIGAIAYLAWAVFLIVATPLLFR